MLPLTLDLAALPVLLVGQGPALERRVELVRQGGAQDIRVCPPGDATGAMVASARLLFVAGIPYDEAALLAGIARAHRVLVNVEDVPELCDFHVPALVRRGDLSIAISTAGVSPGLAAALRRALEAQFDPGWDQHVGAAGELRRRMRAANRTPADIARALEQCAARWLRPDGSPS